MTGLREDPVPFERPLFFQLDLVSWNGVVFASICSQNFRRAASWLGLAPKHCRSETKLPTSFVCCILGCIWLRIDQHRGVGGAAFRFYVLEPQFRDQLHDNVLVRVGAQARRVVRLYVADACPYTRVISVIGCRGSKVGTNNSIQR